MIDCSLPRDPASPSTVPSARPGEKGRQTITPDSSTDVFLESWIFLDRADSKW
jgi:hypothetical protein